MVLKLNLAHPARARASLRRSSLSLAPNAYKANLFTLEGGELPSPSLLLSISILPSNRYCPIGHSAEIESRSNLKLNYN